MHYEEMGKYLGIVSKKSWCAPLQKVVWLIAQLKHLDTSARCVGNKQEELETTVHVVNYDLIAIIIMLWDESHGWSTAMDGYKLFWRGRQGKKGKGVALYVKKWIGYEEVSFFLKKKKQKEKEKKSYEQVESL